MYDMIKQIPPEIFSFLAFACVVLCLYLKLKYSEASSKSKWDNFLEEEQNANFYHKKNFPNDIFLNFDISIIPKTPLSECMEIYTKLSHFVELKMVNLTNSSNRELKETYGIANFNKLIDYEKNYLSLIDILVQYGNILNEHNYKEEAQIVLEYALSIHCNKIKCYELLTQIYKDSQNKEALLKIKESLSKDIINYPYLEKTLLDIEEAINYLSK